MVELKGKRIGFAMTGSFCTLQTAMRVLENLVHSGADIYPVMSEAVWNTDTRFGQAKEFIKSAESLTGKKVIHTITQAEPIGPKSMLDALVIAPCTGNTLSKLARAQTDGCVPMAAKATLRNLRPVIIAISTNDGLGASAENLGALLGRTNVYFVPFSQDDPCAKPDSLVAHMDLTEKTLMYALDGIQLQPRIMEKQKG